jgi:hypothetical protein
VHGRHLPDAQPPRGNRRRVGAHREAIANRQERDVGPIDLAEDLHVAEQARVAPVVDRRRAWRDDQMI